MVNGRPLSWYSRPVAGFRLHCPPSTQVDTSLGRRFLPKPPNLRYSVTEKTRTCTDPLPWIHAVPVGVRPARTIRLPQSETGQLTGVISEAGREGTSRRHFLRMHVACQRFGPIPDSIIRFSVITLSRTFNLRSEPSLVAGASPEPHREITRSTGFRLSLFFHSVPFCNRSRHELAPRPSASHIHLKSLNRHRLRPLRGEPAFLTQVCAEEERELP